MRVCELGINDRRIELAYGPAYEKWCVVDMGCNELKRAATTGGRRGQKLGKQKWTWLTEEWLVSDKSRKANIKRVRIMICE